MTQFLNLVEGQKFRAAEKNVFVQNSRLALRFYRLTSVLSHSRSSHTPEPAASTSFPLYQRRKTSFCASCELHGWIHIGAARDWGALDGFKVSAAFWALAGALSLDGIFHVLGPSTCNDSRVKFPETFPPSVPLSGAFRSPQHPTWLSLAAFCKKLFSSVFDSDEGRRV